MLVLMNIGEPHPKVLQAIVDEFDADQSGNGQFWNVLKPLDFGRIIKVLFIH